MAMNTYLMRKQWMSLGDDFVFNSTEEDGEGVAFTVDNKILHLRETYYMGDADGNTLYKIMERNIPNHRVVIYDDDEEKVAVVRKRGDGTYWAHVDDERDLFVSGDVESGDMTFSNVGGLNVARMTDAWLFAIGDMKQIDIRADQEDSLILAVTVACQYLAGDEGDDDDDDEEQIGLGAILFASAYLLRNAWLSIGDDFVINKIGGEDVGWYVNHKALRLRQYYHLENEDGDTILKIRERVAPRHRMIIEDPDGEKVAVVRKRGDGSYWCHVDDERDIFAEGDASENKLELSNLLGLNVASMSEADLKLFPDGDGFNMVRVRGDQEEDLIMALLVAVQYLVDDEGDDESDGESEGED
mmetsp:Transcript_16847/g.31513  ORF Transcript_16847/g.31513 Transcript_16847/m.31513 type:complete len:357 (-) Transcript_16847:115-1185(-)|eukprot:CAMPEP_0197435198 /NCGR_PEP_ID=MMETSP1175-20131217/2827_1 /TAXON_ID=1003142 /ORGANISM="Triceratium dubium, Strain CCMP147" /LENGTH=356 /DNA_ID=CAMNT_0042964163 /DNA_START=97 /DNA_END=1167 /DNA_ORIENTATION=+